MKDKHKRLITLRLESIALVVAVAHMPDGLRPVRNESLQLLAKVFQD